MPCQNPAVRLALRVRLVLGQHGHALRGFHHVAPLAGSHQPELLTGDPLDLDRALQLGDLGLQLGIGGLEVGELLLGGVDLAVVGEHLSEREHPAEHPGHQPGEHQGDQHPAPRPLQPAPGIGALGHVLRRNVPHPA